jgi:DNA-binding response OmpR family regulator
MTDLEIRLLRYFLDQAGRVVSRQELLASVWDQSPTAKTRTVDVFVARLRRLIEEDTGNPRHILGIRGVGYRLLPEPDIDTPP